MKSLRNQLWRVFWRDIMVQLWIMARLGEEDTAARGIMVRAMEDILADISLEVDSVSDSYMQVLCCVIMPELSFLRLLLCLVSHVPMHFTAVDWLKVGAMISLDLVLVSEGDGKVLAVKGAIKIGTDLWRVYEIGDEMDDFDATREPVRLDKMKSYYLEGEQAMSSDVRTPVCRDGKGKRKITWQDQVPLVKR